MKLIKAKELAENLMEKYKLNNYKLIFSTKMTNSFGYCNWIKKYIKLSIPLILCNGEKQVKTVILHEIAHALTPKHYHNFVWKEKCLEIGGDGKRCWSEKDNFVSCKKQK